jgi:hypothetical protein
MALGTPGSDKPASEARGARPSTDGSWSGVVGFRSTRVWGRVYRLESLVKAPRGYPRDGKRFVRKRSEPGCGHLGRFNRAWD